MPREDRSVIAISLPETDNVLSYVRSRYTGEVPPVGVPAHLTLHFPWMPPTRINERTIAELTSLFSGFPLFDITLELGWFGTEVLLLVPRDPVPLIRLTKAIINRWPEFPYYGGEYDNIEPHVTLAYGDEPSLSKLAAEIADQVPIRVRASTVDLSIGQPGHMVVRARFSLCPADSLAGSVDVRPDA